MHVDKASFLLAVGTLAAGGAGGYVARDRNLVPPTTPPAPTASAASLAAGADAGSAPSAEPTAPPCDDAVGSAAACPPPPYSADESGCAPIATRRCEDFKATMKPRVAERAVSCILSLTPAQRCDANRVNLCGHEALMNACSASAPRDDVSARCHALVAACPSASQRECEETLAGMSPDGRDRIARCMGAHCSDKGLLGCESAGDVK